MPTGYQNAAGVDFDDLFDPYVTGDKPAATGFQTGDAVDLSERYAPILFGTKGPDVAFQNAGGADLSTLWAAKGTATYTIAGLHGKDLVAGDAALTNQPSTIATVTLTMKSDGTWLVFGGNYHGPVAQPAPTSGAWNTHGGVASDYDVQFDVIGGGSNVSNGAPVREQMSANQSVSLTLPSAPANNAIERYASCSVRIRVWRRSTGQVLTDSTISMNVSTVGWA